MASNSQAVLRGIGRLGDCVTPGEVVIVTMGLKAETVAMAEGLNSGISQSLDRSPTVKQSSGTSQNPSNPQNSREQDENFGRVDQQPAKSRNNSSRLDDF